MNVPWQLTPLAFLLVASTTVQQQCDPADDDDGTPIPFQDCSDQTREFWAYDLSVMPPTSQLVTATCRLEGGYAYIYVAEDQWETYVNQEDVEAFMMAFERESPLGALDPDQGIYQNEVEVFGVPPDELDDDPKIYVLLMDLEDYVSEDGDVWQFDGYYGNLDQYPDEVIQAQTFGWYHSNEIEIMYLNSRIRPITDDYSLGVFSHEFQHMIAWEYDESEEIWMSESLAEVAMLVAGYYSDEGWVENYAEWPGYPLVYNGAVNYGECLLWGMYLYEQIGMDFMFHVEREQRDGIDGLNRALATWGSTEDFLSLFTDWMIANVVNDPSTERYGYDFAAIPEMARSAVLGAIGDEYDGQVYPFGVNYIDVVPSRPSVGLQVTPEAPAEDMLVQLVRWEAGQMAEVIILEADGSGAFMAELSGAADGYWTVAISWSDESEVGKDTTTPYTVVVIQ